MTSLETLLKEGTKVLEQHEIQEARLDAWLLLEYVTGVKRALYFDHSDDETKNPWGKERNISPYSTLPTRLTLWALNFM